MKAKNHLLTEDEAVAKYKDSIYIQANHSRSGAGFLKKKNISTQNKMTQHNMTQQILSQIKFITPIKINGPQNQDNSYVIVTALIKDRVRRKNNHYYVSLKGFFEFENLNPQKAAIALWGSKILVFFDHEAYQSQNYLIHKPNNVISSCNLIQMLFNHFHENYDTSDGAINRFYLKFTHKVGNAYVFEKAVL